MKPNIPKGTRDFSPEQVRKRNYLFDVIRKVFVRYGYQPIETSAFENLSTLTGKYGEEGDQLLFKVLNNGDFLGGKGVDLEALETKDSARLAPTIARRGLRYDLTVPFARFVVMNQHALSFPFKRYQIQPVWRADRPQKDRYQEFYQCDVDVVGSDSLMYEAELAAIYDEVFAQLGLKVRIMLNNRKVLAGMAEVAGIPDRFMEMTVSIDKLDKIGMEGVKEEMAGRGIPESSISRIENMLSKDSLEEWKKELAQNETGSKGIQELETVMEYLGETNLTNEVTFTPTLARGLSYYTGCVFEVQALDMKMGSIGGGGRYDDLTSIFGLPNLSGVGVSFGAERIFNLMEELNRFPADLSEDLSLFFVAFDETAHRYAFRCLGQVRNAGIAADLYPAPLKLKKQMKYANDRKVPYVVLIGEEEIQSGKLSLKHMETGQQQKLSLEEIIRLLSV